MAGRSLTVRFTVEVSGDVADSLERAFEELGLDPDAARGRRSSRVLLALETLLDRGVSEYVDSLQTVAETRHGPKPSATLYLTSNGG